MWNFRTVGGAQLDELLVAESRLEDRVDDATVLECGARRPVGRGRLEPGVEQLAEGDRRPTGAAVLDGDEQLVADTLRVLLGTPHGLGHLPLAAGDRVPPGVDHHPPGVAAPHDVSESNGSTVTLGITNGLPIFELHDPTSAR